MKIIIEVNAKDIIDRRALSGALRIASRVAEQFLEHGDSGNVEVNFEPHLLPGGTIADFKFKASVEA